MTEQVRYRIDRDLVKKAEKICRKLGISPGQAVSMFFAQMAHIGGLPFRPSVFPALEDYGVTLGQAEKALNGIARALDKEFEAGETAEFKPNRP